MEKKPTIGFVSAPAYFDPAPSEFAALVEAVGVSAMYPKQRVRLPKFIKISITYLNYNEISHNGKLSKHRRSHKLGATLEYIINFSNF